MSATIIIIEILIMLAIFGFLVFGLPYMNALKEIHGVV